MDKLIEVAVVLALLALPFVPVLLWEAMLEALPPRRPGYALAAVASGILAVTAWGAQIVNGCTP